MSELSCEVIQIKGMGKHPNADTLSITQIYNYPCIIKTEEFTPGDYAIYFPVDALLPNRPIFSFMWKGKENPTEKQRVVKAVRLRGVFSMGLCIPMKKIQEEYGPFEYKVGQNVAELLGVEKYEPPESFSLGGDNEKRPVWFPKYTEIEHLRKYSHVLIPGEHIVITEKIHGTNVAFCYNEERFWVSSHNCVKKLGGGDIWNKTAEKLNIREQIKDFPGLIFYGEIFPVQKGYDYGAKNLSLRVFDIYNIETLRYLDFPIMMQILAAAGLEEVPILHHVRWTNLEAIEEWAEGKSDIGGSHCREGFVVKPQKERWNQEIGRVILKLHGQEYLTGRKK